jgi:hypothetical protein
MRSSINSPGATYVNYGSGLSAPDSWLNFDCSPTLRLQRLPLLGILFARRFGPTFPRGVRYGNIVTGLPISDRACAGVYASHVLEHLALEDFRAALANTWRILAPGGIFRMVVPDLEFLVDSYVHSTDATAAIQFLEGSMLGKKKRPKSLQGMVRELFGNSHHLWMWDHKSLSHELEKAGFVRMRRCHLNDCEDERFRQVEEASRFENALAVEARSPTSSN